MKNQSASSDGGGLGPDLGGDEGFQYPAQQAAVAEHALRVGAQRGGQQARIGEIPLGRPGQAFQSVREPGRRAILTSDCK